MVKGSGVGGALGPLLGKAFVRVPTELEKIRSDCQGGLPQNRFKVFYPLKLIKFGFLGPRDPQYRIPRTRKPRIPTRKPKILMIFIEILRFSDFPDFRFYFRTTLQGTIQRDFLKEPSSVVIRAPGTPTKVGDDLFFDGVMVNAA